MSFANFTITSANVTRVISIATAIFWALSGWLVWHFRAVNGPGLWSELISGDWMQRGGAWIPLLLHIGLCGAVSWALLAPAAIRAFKAELRHFDIKALGRTFWCLSTVPAILLCVWFFLQLIYYRMTGA